MKRKTITITDLKTNNDYFKLQGNDNARKWKKIGEQNRKGKISQQDTEQQLSYEVHEEHLKIDLEHNLIKAQYQQVIDTQNKKLTDLTDNFDKHVQAEKAKLSENLFAKIDLLKAPLNKLKDKIEEVKNTVTRK